MYFAIVGLQLNLVDNFEIPFFLAFLAFACLAKAGSVYAGARLYNWVVDQRHGRG